MKSIFADFFGVTSIDDIAARMAKTVLPSPTGVNRSGSCPQNDQILPCRHEARCGKRRFPERRAGLLRAKRAPPPGGEFIEESKKPVNIVLDEFQEI